MRVLACSLVALLSAAEIDLGDLPERWKERLAAAGVPGLAMAVVVDDQVVMAQAFGVRNAAGDPVDPDTVFYIASCTKSFTATAVLLLADRGVIDLDAPAMSCLPRFELADPAATTTITVRELLCHGQGLTAHPAIVFNDAYTGQITEDRFYRLLRHSVPTGRFAYNNLHFTLLGRVIGQVSGEAWQEFLRDQLLVPVGMLRTSARVSTFVGDDNVAEGLRREADGFVPVTVVKTDATMHAAGGLSSTVLDLARFVRLHLSGGVIDGQRILSAARAGEMCRPFVDVDEDFGPFRRIGHGLGFQAAQHREGAACDRAAVEPSIPA